MTTVLREPFNNFAAWGLTYGTIIAGGRSGTCAEMEAGDARTFSVNSEWLTFGFAFQVDSLTNDTTLLYLLGDGTNTYHNSLVVTTLGRVQFLHTGNGNVRAQSAAGAVTPNTWTHVEVQCRLHDTLGAVTLRINGAQVATTASGDNRNFGTDPVYDTFYLYGGAFSGQVHLFDDLYLKVGPGETFMGDVTFGPELRESRAAAKVGFSEPVPQNWYRSARQSARVGFSEPVGKDWIRNSRQSVRVAFTGAQTQLRLGGEHVRVLSRPGGGNVLVGATKLRVLHRRLPAAATFWNGTSWVAAPMMMWSGSTFVVCPGVKVWNGSAWVDAV